MRALLITLLLAIPAAAEVPVLDIPLNCHDAGWTAHEVMKALGFEVQPMGGLSDTWLYRQTYNTRDWRQLWSQVKKPAEGTGGFLTTVTRLRPHDVEVTTSAYKTDWRAITGRCEVRLDIDYSGHRETLLSEGRDRFRSTGELEARILSLIRWQLIAKGLLKQ